MDLSPVNSPRNSNKFLLGIIGIYDVSIIYLRVDIFSHQTQNSGENLSAEFKDSTEGDVCIIIMSSSMIQLNWSAANVSENEAKIVDKHCSRVSVFYTVD